MDRFYFDHNATTPVSPEVLEVLVPALMEAYGNASSIHHYGQVAKQKLEVARREVAGLIHCHPREVVFVSGGTEANNLALLGTVRNISQARRHAISTTIEHPAVLNPCAQLEKEGVDVSYVAVGSSGVVDPADIRRALRPTTVLISTMHANNELGTIQPIREIADVARAAGVLLHVDGVQAAGKIPVDVVELGVDLYSMSGHKIYAPKGIGVLYVRKGTRLGPILFGGHHEHDRRPGTENIAGAVALGRAARSIVEDGERESERVGKLRDHLEGGILSGIPDARVNCGRAPRVSNTTNICFDGIEGEAIVIALDLNGFAVSSGAACSSGAVEPSHVLTAIGLRPEEARSSIRFSLGRSNTSDQVDSLIEATTAAVARLRKLSPSYCVNA